MNKVIERELRNRKSTFAYARVYRGAASKFLLTSMGLAAEEGLPSNWAKAAPFEKILCFWRTTCKTQVQLHLPVYFFPQYARERYSLWIRGQYAATWAESDRSRAYFHGMFLHFREPRAKSFGADKGSLDFVPSVDMVDRNRTRMQSSNVLAIFFYVFFGYPISASETTKLFTRNTRVPPVFVAFEFSYWLGPSIRLTRPTYSWFIPFFSQ